VARGDLELGIEAAADHRGIYIYPRPSRHKILSSKNGLTTRAFHNGSGVSVAEQGAQPGSLLCYQLKDGVAGHQGAELPDG